MSETSSLVTAEHYRYVAERTVREDDFLLWRIKNACDAAHLGYVLLVDVRLAVPHQDWTEILQAAQVPDVETQQCPSGAPPRVKRRPTLFSGYVEIDLDFRNSRHDARTIALKIAQAAANRRASDASIRGKRPDAVPALGGSRLEKQVGAVDLRDLGVWTNLTDVRALAPRDDVIACCAKVE